MEVEIGSLMSPFGLRGYVVRSSLGPTSPIKLGDIFIASAPFTLTVLGLLMAFPSLSLVLLV